MIADIMAFVLRMALIATICIFVWSVVKPHTQAYRIARAALLVSILLVLLAVLRSAGV